MEKENSWWNNKPKKTTGTLTVEVFDELHKAMMNQVRQPHYYVCSPNHESHKREVKVLLGLKKIPTKKSCPLCNRNKKS